MAATAWAAPLHLGTALLQEHTYQLLTQFPALCCFVLFFLSGTVGHSDFSFPRFN